MFVIGLVLVIFGLLFIDGVHRPWTPDCSVGEWVVALMLIGGVLLIVASLAVLMWQLLP